MDDADGDAENNTDNLIKHNRKRCSLWFESTTGYAFLCITNLCQSESAENAEMENLLWVR